MKFWKRILGVGLWLLCLSVSASAANILWVSSSWEDDSPADIGFTNVLEDAGYTVDWLGIDVGSDPEVMDEDQWAIANTYDLIIMGRDTDAGDFMDDSDEITLWNTISTPMITLTPYTMRQGNLNWFNTNYTIHKDMDFLRALVPGHPLFKGLSVDETNDVIDYQVEGGSTSLIKLYNLSDLGNSLKIGQLYRVDNVKEVDYSTIIFWESGVEFYDGCGQYAGGARLYLAAGSRYDSSGEYNLAEEGEQVFLNAVEFMMNYPYTAQAPSPAIDEEMVECAATTLSWTAPEAYTASGYDIYLDPNETYVANGQASVRVSQDQSSTTCVLSFELDANTTYYWRVNAREPNAVSGEPDAVYGGDVWTFTTAPDAPYIVTSPESLVVAEGESVVFTVEHLNGTDFQWYHDGTAIDGATDVTLTIDDVSKDDEGSYTCNVANAVLTEGETTEAAYLWTERLMAYWTFDGSLTDSVDGWVGTDSNPDGTTYSDDAVSGQSLDVADDGYFIEVEGTEDVFNFYPLGISASAWIRTTDSDGAMISKEPNSDWDTGWALTCYPGTGSFSYRDYDDLRSDVDVDDDQWHFVAGTCELGDDGIRTLRVYVDGLLAEEDTYSGSVNLSTTNLLIGVQEPGGSTEFSGLLDELKVWNYALTAAEIAQMYADATGTSICLGEVEGDLNDDCVVDLGDLSVLSQVWLDSNIIEPSAD